MCRRCKFHLFLFDRTKKESHKKIFCKNTVPWHGIDLTRITVNRIVDYWRSIVARLIENSRRGANHGAKCAAVFAALCALCTRSTPSYHPLLDCRRIIVVDHRERYLSFAKHTLIYHLHAYSNTRWDFRVQRYTPGSIKKRLCDLK